MWTGESVSVVLPNNGLSSLFGVKIQNLDAPETNLCCRGSLVAADDDLD